MSIPTAPGIYRITCTVTGKFYIGSAINLRNRWYEHCKLLQRKTHHNPKLQAAWNKYGPDAFTFEVLELVLPMSLTAREQYWFNKLQPFDKKGFNLAPIAGSNFGRKLSPEQIEQMRLRRLGQKASDEARRKMSESQAGRTHAAETIEKMRVSALRRPPRSPETCAKISASHKGKPAHNRGKKASPEQIENMRRARADDRKTLIVTSPDGIETTIQGIRQFCKDHDLNRSALMQVAKGKCRHHKGWKARYPPELM